MTSKQITPNSVSTPTREKVLLVAFELFLQHGYEGTSLSQIVGTSGVSKGAFYHYFPSKFAIYKEAVETFFLLPFQKIKASDLAKMSPKKARSTLRKYYAALPEQMNAATSRNMSSVFALMFDSFSRLPDFHDKISSIYSRMLKSLTTSFRAPNTPRKRAKRRARKFLAGLEGELFLQAVQNKR